MRRPRAVPGLAGLRLTPALVLAVVVGCAAPPPPAPPPVLVWPAPPEPARIRYVGSVATPGDLQITKSWLRRVWDLVAGPSPARVIRPYGVAADAAGRIYVADSVARAVHVFDPQGQSYRALEAMGRRRFEAPIGVAVSPDGMLFVSDAGLRTVAVFDRHGGFLRELGQQLQRPTGLALGPGGDRLYIVDTLSHQIAVYHPDGRWLGTFGERGSGSAELNFPTNVAVGRSGLVYVSDSMNFEVKVFSPDGQPVGRFGRLGDGSGDFARPKGIGVDSDGHIYVVEGIYDVFQVFDREGRFLLAVGGTGSGPGRFWLPTGLHVGQDDRIYVADAYNSRIQIFEYLRGGG